MGDHHLVVRAGAEVRVGIRRSESHVLHVSLIELRVKHFGIADNIEPEWHDLQREVLTTSRDDEILSAERRRAQRCLVRCIVSRSIICDGDTVNRGINKLCSVIRAFMRES